jgi:RNA polymerase sigma-70 factor, ECF subfamily
MSNTDLSFTDRLAHARRDPDVRGRLLAECCERALRGPAEREAGAGQLGHWSASDLIQETIVEADRGFANCRASTEAELFRWLRMIFLNNLRDRFRRHRLPVQPRHGESGRANGGEPPAPDTSPSERAARRERESRLEQALSQLPERQRLAITLRHLQGRPLKEVAAQLNCTYSAAAGLVKHGLRNLRTLLGPDSWI